MRARENSSISRPSTIDQSPPEVVTGNEEIRPSGTPYSPLDTTAIETQSSAAEPKSQSRAASIVADAAEAAEDEPRASMIAAPRLATVGMKSFSSQAWSPTSLGGVLAVDLGVEEVGVLGRRVVAPDRHLRDVGDLRAGLGRELRDRAVVVEAGQRGEALARDVGGVGHRDEGVGVGRVAGDADAHVVGGDRVEGLALRGEDRAVGREQVAALHAGAARAGADEQGEVDAVEDLLGVRADLDAGEVRERAVVELHDDALERLEGGLDLEQAQLDRAVGGQRAAREAEEQAVADLAGGAGDGHLEGFGGHGSSPREGWSGGRLSR